MFPTTLTQLIGAIIYVAAILFGALKGWKWFLDAEAEKAKQKAAVEIAKYKDSVLNASQIMQLMTTTNEVKEDIVTIKAENKDRNEQLAKAMDKLENNLKEFENLFQQYLLRRVNQFEQTLIK